MKVSGRVHAPAALGRKRNLGTHWIGGWVGSRAGLDFLENKKISWPCQMVQLAAQSLYRICYAGSLKQIQYFNKKGNHAVDTALQEEIIFLYTSLNMSV
jgi:hypothetical protein